MESPKAVVTIDTLAYLAGIAVVGFTAQETNVKELDESYYRHDVVAVKPPIIKPLNF